LYCSMSSLSLSLPSMHMCFCASLGFDGIVRFCCYIAF